MAYKKYIKRNGKLYGPYIYSSKRVDGKVVSEYRGTETKSYRKFLWIFLGIFLIAGIFYIIFHNGEIGGKVVLGIDATFQEGKPLEGNLNLVLKEGELIPASSKIVFENLGQRYEFFLRDLIEETPVEGNFYVEGTSISGSGEGYGIEGESIIYPGVEFTLLLYKDSSSDKEIIEEIPKEIPVVEEPVGETPVEEPSEENSVEEPVGETPVEEPSEENSVEEPVEEIIVEESIVEESEEIPVVEEPVEETESIPITGSAVRGLGRIFKSTGKVSLNLEKEIQGIVSKNNPFVYELNEGETAELKHKSVISGSQELKDNDISFKIEGIQVIVTTEYSENLRDYGEEYLGDKEKEISIDLSGLNMLFEKGELVVSLVYEEEEMLFLSTVLDEEETISEQIILETPELEENMENASEVDNKSSQNKSIIDVDSFLTDEERIILADNFGNSSIETVKTELFKNKIIVSYAFSNYSIEFSYDSFLTEEDLEIQMEKDRIKWLKDIVSSLKYEKTFSEEIEGFNSSYSF